MDILIVSLPKARYFLHLYNISLWTDMLCFLLGTALIIICAALLDKDYSKHKQYNNITVAVLAFGFACIVVTGLVVGGTTTSKSNIVGNIQYDKAVKIKQHYSHLSAFSKEGRKYGKLMAESKSNGRNAKAPQWWQYF